MSTATSERVEVRNTHTQQVASSRAAVLAERLERGARQLATLAASLTPAQWETRVPGDNRKIGVVVHHVASVYPVEIGLAQQIAGGTRITGVTMADIHTMNAGHARDHDTVTQEQTLELLARNSADAAAAIRALTDEQLDRAVVASLYDDAPITCQFMLEDHAVRHSYHHYAVIARTLVRAEQGAQR